MAANPSIQLGTDGNWAIKEDNLLAYRKDGTRFFNKEFNFSRGSLATFVDKDGLIKVSGVTSTELVINGGFDTDSDWTKNNGATISDGKANIIGDGSTFTYIQQVNVFEIGKYYKITADVTINSGLGLKFQDGTTNENFGFALTTGSYTFYGTANSPHFTIGRRHGGTAFDSYVDNISVKEIQLDVPRIDFKNNTTGHLLLEPQTTNRVPTSENTPQSSSNVVLTQNYATSPDGNQNSLKVQKTGTSANDRIFPISNFNATLVSGNEYSMSAFVKNIDVRNTGITTMACRISGGSLFRRGFEWDGSSLSLTSDYEAGNPTNVFVENYSNDWWRIGFTFVPDGTSGNFELDIDRDFGSDTTSIETWGWQLENATYVTSYIPTSGSTVTRNAEVCNNSGSVQDFNSEEGVLYAEIAALANSSEYREISLNDGNTINAVEIRYTLTANNLQFVVRDNGAATVAPTITLSNALEFNKIAFSYKTDDSKMYVNGIEVAIDTNCTMPNGLNRLSFNWGTIHPFYGKVKNIKVFKRALSDTELQKLTT